MNFQGQTVYKIDQRMESDIKDAVAKNAQQVAPCTRKKVAHQEITYFSFKYKLNTLSLELYTSYYCHQITWNPVIFFR
jgi:hypothetical protein